MKRIQRFTALLCMLALLLGSLPAASSAEEKTPATPTDLEPVAAGDHETDEEAADSLEIIITKSLLPGQAWNGTVKRKTPSIIKIDFDYAQTVHILIEGHDVLAAVQKADRYNDHPEEKQTDPETDRLVIDLSAEAGSYLLSVRAGENSLLAKVIVSVMTQEAYEAWLEENQTDEAEEQPEEKEPEPAEETEEKTGPDSEAETEETKEEQPEEITEENKEEDNHQAAETDEEAKQIPATERSIAVNLTWDVPNPMVGDTAHFKATLTGYEGMDYSMQWQYSLNRSEWIDLTGETADALDVVVTEENNFFYWRIIVYLEEDEES